jgi:hypothetical protein
MNVLFVNDLAGARGVELVVRPASAIFDAASDFELVG